MTLNFLRPTSLALLAALGSLAAPAAQAVNVGVPIGFSQPGVHGRIDIGRYPARWKAIAHEAQAQVVYGAD